MAGIDLGSSSMRTVRSLDDALNDSTAGVAHPDADELRVRMIV